jgi:hypothetical protein
MYLEPDPQALLPKIGYNSIKIQDPRSVLSRDLDFHRFLVLNLAVCESSLGIENLASAMRVIFQEGPITRHARECEFLQLINLKR